MKQPAISRAALPQVLLFDLDDTLLDFSSGSRGCWEGACAGVADRLPCPPAELLAMIEEVRHWYWSDPERHRIGRLDMAAARRGVVARALRRLGHDRPALAAEIAAVYTRAREAAMALRPDAKGVLDVLRQHGVRLGLVTNGTGRDQRAKIDRFGLAPYFACVVIEGEFGVGKPDERVYRHALAQLGVPPAKAAMVGDNLEWDVAAPQRLGMRGVWYDPERNGLPPECTTRPDDVIASLTELLPA